MEEDVINHPSHYERLNVTVRPIDCFERFSTNIGCIDAELDRLKKSQEDE